MAIVQDVFDIPDDIATKLATGVYKRIGSVVRYAVGPKKGQIVKHLKPIDLKSSRASTRFGCKGDSIRKTTQKGCWYCSGWCGTNWCWRVGIQQMEKSRT